MLDLRPRTIAQVRATVLHERDHRIEFLMRWRDQEQAKHGSNEPPFQRLKEIALVLRHLEQRLESLKSKLVEQ